MPSHCDSQAYTSHTAGAASWGAFVIDRTIVCFRTRSTLAFVRILSLVGYSTLADSTP